MKQLGETKEHNHYMVMLFCFWPNLSNVTHISGIASRGEYHPKAPFKDKAGKKEAAPGDPF